MTQCLTQQLTLVNLISINESHLQRNFRLILNKISKQDKIIQHLTKQTINLDEKIKSFEQKVIKDKYEDLNNLKTVIQRQIHNLQQKKNIEMREMIILVEEKNNQKINQKIQTIRQQILKIQKHFYQQVDKLVQQLGNKQNRSESDKLERKLMELQEKQKIIEKDISLANHKVEKIIILKEKQIRQQAKKDAELIKNIQQKINKTIKNKNNYLKSNNHHDLQNNQPPNIKNQYSNNNFNLHLQCNKENKEDYIMSKNEIKTLKDLKQNIGQNNIISKQYSQKANQEYKNTYQGNDQKKWIIKINDQLESQPMLNSQNVFIRNNQENNNAIDIKFTKYLKQYSVKKQQILDIKENVKKLNEKITILTEKVGTLSKINTELKKENVNQPQNSMAIQRIKQQIHELKQQNSKLFGKIDVFSDKILSFQRKNEERNKTINEFIMVQKENNFAKLKQDIKNISTQFGALLRDFNQKLQLKTNLVDWEKFIFNYQENIRGIKDSIYQKCDKMQVKKALLFLQTKIKEIIIVMSKQQQQQKQALLTKKQLKCMSCDKEIDTDKFGGTTSFKKQNWNSLPLRDSNIEFQGKYGMSNYGTLLKKGKKGKNGASTQKLPLIQKKSTSSFMV